MDSSLLSSPASTIADSQENSGVAPHVVLRPYSFRTNLTLALDQLIFHSSDAFGDITGFEQYECFVD